MWFMWLKTQAQSTASHSQLTSLTGECLFTGCTVSFPLTGCQVTSRPSDWFSRPSERTLSGQLSYTERNLKSDTECTALQWQQTYCWLYDHAILTTNKASIFEYQLLLLLLTSEVSERVDDDTKNKVQNNDDDNEEEQQVINNSSHKQRFLQTHKIKTCLH